MWQELNLPIPVESQIIDTTINGMDILITMVGGKLFATQDNCPHEDIKISLGCINPAGRLKCSLHGFSFDLTSGKCDNIDVENLITYPIKIENNTILVNLTKK